MSGSPDESATVAEGFGLLAVEVEEVQPDKLNVTSVSAAVTKWCGAGSLMVCEVA